MSDRTEELQNPWQIQSIYDLQYFNCPTCEYKNHSKQEFVNHAYDFHPNSIDFLANINDESFVDIVCPWDMKNIKKEEFEYDEVPVDPDLIANSLQVVYNNDQTNKCHICGKVFISSQNLLYHMEKLHSTLHQSQTTLKL